MIPAGLDPLYPAFLNKKEPAIIKQIFHVNNFKSATLTTVSVYIDHHHFKAFFTGLILLYRKITGSL
jgi:hypothetical protein